MKLFPWHGFLYELRRGLMSIPLLVLTALIILAAFSILAEIASTQPAPSTFPEESGAYFFTDGEYHFEFYAYTQSDVPISGAVFTVNIYPPNETQTVPLTSLANGTGSTGSSGMVEFAVPLNGTNYTAIMQWSPPNAPLGFGGPGPLLSVFRPPPGVTSVFGSSWTATIQTTHRFLLSYNLLIYYPGPNGTAPPNYQVYWAASPNESLPASPLPEGSMHRLGSLNSPAEAFSPVVPAYPVSTTYGPFQEQSNGYLQVELFTTTGHLVAMDTNQSVSNFFPPLPEAGTREALAFGGIFMVYLAPLMAILATYSVYGRDRLTGVLEGVLARPVSRLGLATSRYLAVILALCIAVSLAMACLDGLVYWVYGGFVSLYGALTLFSSLLVEVGAFAGVTFLLSHTFRSAGGLVGISLGLFALLTVGWLIIPLLIGGVTGTLFTPGYETAMVHLDFLNPVQFYTLAQYQYFASVPSNFGLFSMGPTHPSAYGITLGTLIATGLAWTVLPLVGFFYSVRHWD